MQLGYDIEYKLLDAADFGVPQKRERIYIVGFNKRKVRAAEFKFPRPHPIKVTIGKFIEMGAPNLSISEHLQENKKDFSTNRGLMMLVGKRKRLLTYLKDNDLQNYRQLIEKVGLRK